MTASVRFQRILLTGVVLALFIVAFGLYRVFDAIHTYNDLDAIPTQPLVDSAQSNPVNGTTLMILDRQKHDALIQRSESLSIIGFGAVLLGIVGLLYTRLPQQPKELPMQQAGSPPG